MPDDLNAKALAFEAQDFLNRFRELAGLMSGPANDLTVMHAAQAVYALETQAAATIARYLPSWERFSADCPPDPHPGGCHDVNVPASRERCALRIERLRELLAMLDNGTPTTKPAPVPAPLAGWVAPEIQIQRLQARCAYLEQERTQLLATAAAALEAVPAPAEHPAEQPQTETTVS